jgi:hypothetical protein
VRDACTRGSSSSIDAVDFDLRRGDDRVVGVHRPSGVTLTPEDIPFRNTTSLKLNHFWPQSYVTDPSEAWIEFDDMIVGTARIGSLHGNVSGKVRRR